MRHLLYVGILVSLLSVTLLGLCGWHLPQGNGTLTFPEAAALKPEAGSQVRIRFRDIAKQVGLRFRHIDSPSDMHFVPEIMGGGAAWLDYDQDGFIDLFLVQGGKFPPEPDEPRTRPSSRLYRNLGDGHFADVTEEVGIWHPSFGQGVAAGDYDNDGYPDLFVACFGHAHLYHNEPSPTGGRRFREVTQEAGIRASDWCATCAFADLHGTGYLDLIVGRYVKLDLRNYPYCGAEGRAGPRYACGPREFLGQRSFIFRNNGNGTFTDVSEQAGLAPDDKVLGILVLDFDDDGKPDLFFGNDEIPNSHYRNLGNGKLQSCGVISGTAATWQGRPMGSMGVDADDVTGDGRPDLLITTFYQEGIVLFRNNGGNLFTDISQTAGMYAHSLSNVGWGTGLFDVDHDGSLDVIVVNGHVYRNDDFMTELKKNKEIHTFRQAAQLFRGNGKGLFQLVEDPGGYFHERHVGRGLALGDYDNDGLMDVAINNCGDDAVLLHNETRTPHHWIRLQLEGNRHLTPAGSNRDAIGAKVTLRIGPKTIVRHVKAGGSYYSNHDRRLLIGVGDAARIDDVEVRWPNAQATVQSYGPLEAGRSYKLMEGASAEPAHAPRLK